MCQWSRTHGAQPCVRADAYQRGRYASNGFGMRAPSRAPLNATLRVTKEGALGLGIELENSSSRRARLTVFLSTLTLSRLSTIIRPPKQVLNLTGMA